MKLFLPIVVVSQFDIDFSAPAFTDPPVVQNPSLEQNQPVLEHPSLGQVFLNSPSPDQNVPNLGDIFISELLSRMGLGLMQQDLGQHPCEPFFKKYNCDNVDTKFLCLSFFVDELSPTCKVHIEHTVPNCCKEEILTMCSVPAKNGQMLRCLEENINFLKPGCRNAVDEVQRHIDDVLKNNAPAIMANANNPAADTGDCFKMLVGTSDSNPKTVTLDRPGASCTGPVNVQEEGWTDTFAFTVSGNQLIVTRTDGKYGQLPPDRFNVKPGYHSSSKHGTEDRGWGQELEVNCCGGMVEASAPADDRSGVARVRSEHAFEQGPSGVSRVTPGISKDTPDTGLEMERPIWTGEVSVSEPEIGTAFEFNANHICAIVLLCIVAGFMFIVTQADGGRAFLSRVFGSDEKQSFSRLRYQQANYGSSH